MIGLSAPALFLLSLAVANPGDEFEWGRNAFLRGEYARAIGLLHPLLYPDLRLGSEQEVIQAHRMLGVAYLFENHPVEAKRELRKLLELAPDFKFDPYLDPPRVVEFFQSIVREQREELGDIEARLRKREAELLSKRAAGGVVERRIERHSYGLNFVPFGAGQFQNGERRKGFMFLAVESALGLTSLAAFTTNFAVYGVRPIRPCLDPVTPLPDGSTGMCPPDRVDRTGENRSALLTGIQVASGGLFFAAAIWGIVDAVRHFRAEIPMGETYLPPSPSSSERGEHPREGNPASSAVTPPSHLFSTLSLVPSLSPTSSAAMLEISF